MGDGIIAVIFIILIISVLATIGVVFGMQEFTAQLINNLGLFAILILAIPPIGLIIGFIVLIKKSLDNSRGI